MKKSRNSVSLILLFLMNSILILSLKAQSSEVEFYSPDRMVEFGDHLFCTKDYIRAINEYKNVLKKNDNDTVIFKTGISLRELSRYSEAEDYFKDLFFNSELDEEAKLEVYKTLYYSNQIDELRERYSDKFFIPGKYKSEVQKLNNITYLNSRWMLIDSTQFFLPFNQEESIELLKFYMRKKHPDRKDPLTAALLSSVIPGLGKVYAGEYTDGLTSLLLTGVLSFISYDNFDAGHDFRGWLFAGLATYFYAGNIYGSAAAAHRYNATVQFNFENDLNIYLNKKNHFMPSYNLCE